MSLRIGVIGFKGHIGREMLKLGCIPLECDVRDFDSVENILTEHKPKMDVVLNLACKSDVDWCEREENQKEAIQVNFRGAWNVASIAESLNLFAVHISSDHIFDGKKGPYREDAVWRVPVNYYGSIKMAMEAGVLQYKTSRVVRTSYLFDDERVADVRQKIAGGIDFPTFIRRSFMYSKHFAYALYDYACRVYEMPEVLHISGSETISWYEFALSVAGVWKLDKELVTPRKKLIKGYEGAARPRNGGLVTSLSAKHGIPQFDFLRGLHSQYQDVRIHELGYVNA